MSSYLTNNSENVPLHHCQNPEKPTPISRIINDLAPPKVCPVMASWNSLPMPALNAAVVDWLIHRFASGEASSEDMGLAVEFLAVNDVRHGGRNDLFEGLRRRTAMDGQ